MPDRDVESKSVTLRSSVCLLLILGVTALYAEDLIRCGEAYGEGESYISEERWVLRSISPDEFRRIFGKSSETIFDEFDSRHGVSKIAVRSSAREWPNADGSPYVALLLGFHLTRNGKHSFFQLVEENGRVPRIDNDVPGDDPPPRHPRVSLAPASGKPPLIRVEYDDHWMGAHAAGVTHNVLVFDFRMRKGRAARVSCTDGWMGGACTAFDAIYSPRRALRCRWSAADGDFVCTERLNLDAVWTKKESLRRFELFSGRAHKAPEAETTFADLKSAAEAMQRRPRRVLTVDGIGVLQRVINGDDNRVAVYAAADGSHKMLLRLYAFDLRGSTPSVEPVQVLRIPEIVSAHVTDIEARFDDVATDWHLDLSDYSVDPRMHYTVLTPLHRIRTIRHGYAPPNTSAHRLIVSEGLERAVFFVIVDEDAPLRVSAIRLASTAPEYVQCNAFLHPSSASRLDWKAAASRFELDIQPGYLRAESLEEDRLLGECMVSGTLTWTRAAGFAIQRGETCKGPRQGVAIADDGSMQAAVLPPKPAYDP